MAEATRTLGAPQGGSIAISTTPLVAAID